MSAGRWIITDGARWFFDAGADSLDFTSGPDSEVRHWLAERFERLPLAEIGERELVDALGLRQAIGRLAAAKADGVAPAPDDVDTLNLFAATPDVPPVLAGGRRQAGAGSIRVGQALSSLARDAVAMIGADDGRLRRCDADDCRMVFHDESRTGTRRWCSMQRCGNRAKVRAFRAKARGSMSILESDRPVPTVLRTDEFMLRPITADDAERDYAALMESREYLRLWEQSSWPADDFTVEANRDDLAGLEQRHAEHRAFTYTVVDPDDTQALGCVYVFPTSAKFLVAAAVTAVGDDAWADVDVVVYFWTRRSRMEQGMDERLLAALRGWFRDEWKAERTVYVTNEQFTQQAELLRRSDLALKFELVEPEKPGTYLVFG